MGGGIIGTLGGSIGYLQGSLRQGITRRDAMAVTLRNGLSLNGRGERGIDSVSP